MAETISLPDRTQMQSEIKGFMSERQMLVARTMAIRITNDPEKFAASEFMASILYPLRKRIDDKRKEYSLTLRRLATQWDTEFKPALESIDGLIAYVKQDIIRYDQEQEETSRKQQEKLHRKAEEERREAEARGEVSQIPEQIVELAPAVAKTMHTAGGSSTVRKIPIVVITDESLIPRKYLMVDHSKLDPDVKTGIQVPGARLDVRTEVTVRAK